MYCENCGALLSENGKFCGSCGTKQDGDVQTSQTGENPSLIGFSDKIHDPRVAETLEKMNKSSVKFALILAVIAIIGFTIAGALEVGGFELPFAFFLGLGLGGLLIVISLFQGKKRKKDVTWDGVVIDKTHKGASYSDMESGDHRTRYYVHVRRDDGSINKLNSTEALFHYYKIGDRVRHHACSLEHILEKYDKSQDSVIYCIVCSSKNDINNDFCHRCKSPLMK